MNEYERIEHIKHDIELCKEWPIESRIHDLENELKEAEKKLHDREYISYLSAKLDMRMEDK